MVNVGSVGQPRDGDNRACYVILEDGLADESSNGERRAQPATGPGPEDHLSPACPTTSRPPSRRSTPFPSSSRSWATGSGRDGSQCLRPPRVSSVSASHDQKAAGRAAAADFWYSSVAVWPVRGGSRFIPPRLDAPVQADCERKRDGPGAVADDRPVCIS